MRCKCGLIAIVIAFGLISWATAQGEYELRTMLVDPTTSTDEAYQFGLSKLRGTYVCPVCGYSAILPPGAYTCPNPYNLPAAAGEVHEAPVALVPASTLRARVLDVAKWLGVGVLPTNYDIQYRDTTTVPTDAGYNLPNQFRWVLGRPFHPMRTGAVALDGNNVYAEFGWPNRLPAWQNTRVRFLTLPPGAKQPSAYHCGLVSQPRNAADVADWTTGTSHIIGDLVKHGSGLTPSVYRCIDNHTSANANEPPNATYWETYHYGYNYVDINQINDWAEDDDYIVGDLVRNGTAPDRQVYRCTEDHTATADDEPGTGTDWTDNWEKYPFCEISLNPHRAADGGRYYVRYTAGNGWRVQVYSKLYGLELDTGSQSATVTPQRPVTIISASGSMRVKITNRPPYEPPAWANNTDYVTEDLVTESDVVYRCYADHTSDTANDQPGSGAQWAEYWVVVRPAYVTWQDAYAYVRGDLVKHVDPGDSLLKYYRCRADHTSAAGAAGNEPAVGATWSSNWYELENECWEVGFETHSSARTYPDPVNQAQPSNFGSPPSMTDLTNAGLTWPVGGIYFRFAGGSHARSK